MLRWFLGGFALRVLRLAWLKQFLQAAAANAFVFLLSVVLNRDCIVEPVTVLQQAIFSKLQGALLLRLALAKRWPAAAATKSCQTSLIRTVPFP